MGLTYETVIFKDKEMNATGIPVPEDVVAALGAGRRPKVKVTLKGHTYRTTGAVMGGAVMLPLSAEHRQAANVEGGERVAVTLELDTEPRLVPVPDDLAQALKKARLEEVFEKLAVSYRKEYVRQVEEAKAPETRARRIAKVVDALGMKK